MQEIIFMTEYFLSFLANETTKSMFTQRNYFSNTEDLEFDLILSHEVIQFCHKHHPYSFKNIPDIRHTLHLTKKDYLLDIKDVFYTFSQLQQWIEISKLPVLQQEFPIFHSYIHEIYIPTVLLNYWNNTFDTDGNILDSASPELKKIRSLKKNLRKQIEKFLAPKLQNNEDLAEKRIAFREDRYVLPIKNSAKNRIQGIVHGFSGTGLVYYIEPQEIIHLNNELLSVDDLEQQEIYRLLRQWSQTIQENLHDIIVFIERSAEIEILFAKFHLQHKLNAQLGTLNTNREIILEKVYNPFLLIKKGISAVIPINITLESNKSGIIISGPNAGGKSAALKTLAICTHLFLMGLPIPAQTISLPLFTELLIEIGDSQNLDNDLSTFSGHLSHLKEILSTCTKNSLILIDEIAHATDPIEGEALGYAIIDELIKKESFFAITTHYKQVKLKSFEHSKIKTYAAGFDIKTLSPQFILYPNTIGESYALNIAERIGIDSHIINSAAEMIQNKQNKTEIILANIEEYEKQLNQKEQELLYQQQKLDKLRTTLEQHQKELSEKTILLKEKGIQQADKELSACLQELSYIQKNIAKKPKESTKKLTQQQQLIKKKKEELANLSYKKKTLIKIGDIVFIASLNKQGTIEDILDNYVLVRVGIIKISVKKSDIFETHPVNIQKKIHTKKINYKDVSHCIDVHGMTVDEALKNIDNYLYKAIVSGLFNFTIIHGKGAGILQKAIHQHLKNIPEIKDYRFATPQEGGSGKTIIDFIN